MIKAERVCVVCGNIFTLTPLNIKQRLCKTNTGEQIQVTYCECEECGAVNVYQLDDERTMEDLKKITSLIGRVMRDRRSGKARDKEKDQATRKKLEGRIESRRNQLIRESSGKTFYERNGKILIKKLDFSEVV